MRHTSYPTSINATFLATIACTGFATCALLFGCQPTTGGDSPVTAQRLSGTKLTDIKRPLTWKFAELTVLIEYEGQPIPSDLVEALLEDGSNPVRIEASWHLDEEAGTLRLSDVKADQTNIDKEITIPLAPAGQVRVNLGSRQYNLSRDRTTDPQAKL